MFTKRFLVVSPPDVVNSQRSHWRPVVGVEANLGDFVDAWKLPNDQLGQGTGVQPICLQVMMLDGGGREYLEQLRFVGA
jgi:hypothetical protein